MSTGESLRSATHLDGFWCVTGHPSIVESAAAAKPDFICIDTQHGVHLSDVEPSLFAAMAHYGVPGLVRVESTDAAAIGRALDLGAAGVVVPLVDSADQARAVVPSTVHAPHGSRSYGMQTLRKGPFDERPFVVIQVETAGAVEEIDAIAALDGVDALYIGPADLGLALGGVPATNVDEVFEGTHPLSDDLRKAFAAVVEAAGRHEIFAGLHTGSGASTLRAKEHGFTMSAVATDTPLVKSVLARELALARDDDPA